jgi:hypothetical protein
MHDMLGTLRTANARPWHVLEVDAAAAAQPVESRHPQQRIELRRLRSEGLLIGAARDHYDRRWLADEPSVGRWSTCRPASLPKARSA